MRCPIDRSLEVAADSTVTLLAEGRTVCRAPELNRLSNALGIGSVDPRGTFSSVKALTTRIRGYSNHWNSTAAPFVWAATADRILAKVCIVQTNVGKIVESTTK